MQINEKEYMKAEQFMYHAKKSAVKVAIKGDVPTSSTAITVYTMYADGKPQTKPKGEAIYATFYAFTGLFNRNKAAAA